MGIQMEDESDDLGEKFHDGSSGADVKPAYTP